MQLIYHTKTKLSRVCSGKKSANNAQCSELKHGQK